VSHKKGSNQHKGQPDPKVQTPSSGTPEKNPHSSHSNPECKYQPSPEPKRVWGMTIFERIMAALTLVAVLVAACTVLAISNQSDVMKRDQRPWVRAWFDAPPFQFSNPVISITIHAMDYGKTPAKSLNGVFFIERVENGAEPSLPGDKPFATAAEGTQFPNIPADSTLQHAHSLSKTELDDLSAKKIFFVIYGTFTYTDFFNTKHWTRFCQPWILVQGDYSFKKCTEYSDVDNN
jgi:hypothetical protein